MITEPAAFAPFDVALHSKDLRVPVRLNWRQGVRESRGAFYAKLGGPLALVASTTMTVIGVGLCFIASRPLMVGLGLLYIAFFVRWSPLSRVLDMAIAWSHGFRPDRSAQWILGANALEMSPQTSGMPIEWAKVTRISVVADTAIVVYGNGGYGLAAQAGGPSVEEIVLQLERRTGLTAARPNRLLWFLSFGPSF